MNYVYGVLVWTFSFYLMHRLVHIIPGLKQIHADHHAYVLKNQEKIKWHWSNFFFFTDTWISTVDLWITDIIPTIVVSYFFGWEFFIFYYVWAAFLQENIEHNEKFNFYPFLTGGRWHMIHHRKSNKNYGLFFPIWDMIFGTWEGINDNEKSMVKT